MATKSELTAPRENVDDYHQSGRPQFHFTSLRNSLNAPNGLVFYNGEYHMFFQHNPIGNSWGNMTWGHAVSDDLVRWRQLDNAIEPDSLGTIYSGSAVVDYEDTAGFQAGNGPALVAVYTAAGGSSPESEGQPFTQCLAHSNDGRSLTKYANNPVLPHVVGENRDPKVTWYAPGRFWVMVLFLDGESFGLFTSPNMKNWKRIQTITLSGSSECPDFFPMHVQGAPDDDRWIMTAANGRYLLGRFNGREFTDMTGPYVLDYGSNFYAPQTFSDIPASDGRRIQIAWMAGGVYPGMPFNQQMSFPTELTLRNTPHGPRIYRWPVAEIQSLVEDAAQWRNVLIAPGENLLHAITGDLIDISVDALCEAGTVFGFRIGGREIRYSVADNTISCLGRSVIREGDDPAISLRILADLTSIEIFVDGGRMAMSFCVTPSAVPRAPLELFVVGSSVTVSELTVSTLRSIWPGGAVAA